MNHKDKSLFWTLAIGLVLAGVFIWLLHVAFYAPVR